MSSVAGSVGFSKGLNGQAEGGIAWANFVGVVVTVGTVVALVLAVGQQFLRVLVAVSGPIRTWTRKRILGLAFVLAFTVSLLTLIESGLWTQWPLDLGKFISEQISNTPIGAWIPKILLIAGTTWMVLRTLSWVEVRWLKVRDRINALASAVCLSLFEALLILFVFDAPSNVTRPIIYAFFCSMVGLGALSAGAAGLDWISKYRASRSY